MHGLSSLHITRVFLLGAHYVLTLITLKNTWLAVHYTTLCRCLIEAGIELGVHQTFIDNHTLHGVSTTRQETDIAIQGHMRPRVCNVVSHEIIAGHTYCVPYWAMTSAHVLTCRRGITTGKHGVEALSHSGITKAHPTINTTGGASMCQVGNVQCNTYYT